MPRQQRPRDRSLRRPEGAGERLTPLAEELLWEAAFVLHLTEAVKKQILAEKGVSMPAGGPSAAQRGQIG